MGSRTLMWNKKCCMVSSWNLLIESEYLDIMPSLSRKLSCVNLSILQVFRRQVRYPIIFAVLVIKNNNHSRKHYHCARGELSLCYPIMDKRDKNMSSYHII